MEIRVTKHAGTFRACRASTLTSTCLSAGLHHKDITGNMYTGPAKTNEDKPRNPASPDRNVLATVSPWQTPSRKVRSAISQLRNLSLLRHALLCPLLILVLFGCATDETSFTPESEATIAPPTEISLAPNRENSTPRATGRSADSKSEILNAVVPPCTPYPGSRVDPCERRDTWPPIDPYTHVEYELIEPAPSLQDVYLSIIDLELYNSAPHFVVRAIPIPGTTRCGTVKSFGTSFSAVDGNREGLFDHTHCWVDLAVNEYIVNSGPARLTIDIGVWIPNYEQDGLDREARVFGDRFEGWEWIITLNAPWDPNNASWRIGWLQDVQMREDGTVVVVSWEKRDYMLASRPEFRSINLERAEVTLSEYRRQANEAYLKFFETTGGRIFVGNDVNGNPLPSLAKDATDESLRDYISEVTVVDPTEYTAKSPPTVPGANDPDPAGLTVNDVIATRVAGGAKE